MGAGEFEETSKRVMTLPEDDAETVDRMIQWLYSGKYKIDEEALKDFQRSQVILMQLARLYVCADKYGIIKLKDDIIDQVHIAQKPEGTYLPGSDIISYVYQNTTKGSRLRRLIVEWFAWYGSASWFGDSAVQAILCQVPEFLADMVAKVIAKNEGAKDPWEQPVSSFHERVDGAAAESSGDVSSLSDSNNSSGDESSSTA